jgi:hypothetical protein
MEIEITKKYSQPAVFRHFMEMVGNRMGMECGLQTKSQPTN